MEKKKPHKECLNNLYSKLLNNLYSLQLYKIIVMIISSPTSAIISLNSKKNIPVNK